MSPSLTYYIQAGLDLFTVRMSSLLEGELRLSPASLFLVEAWN